MPAVIAAERANGIQSLRIVVTADQSEGFALLPSIPRNPATPSMIEPASTYDMNTMCMSSVTT